MRIVFMGTPPFAATALEALFAAGHEVAAVYTQPDKPVGRRAVLTPPPVKTLAEAHGVPVYQPVRLRDGVVADQLRGLAPEVIVVVAYGRLLPPEILAVPRLGCINVHASLLPRWRGAAPIAAALLHGDSETGVTTMYMAEGLDTGDIIEQCVTPVDPDENEAELRGRLAVLGAALLTETLRHIADGTAPRIPQDDARATHVAMIEKADARVDWSRPARELHDLVRAMYGWPVAHCVCGGKTLRIHRARVSDAALPDGAQPGDLVGGKRPVVVCGEGALELLEVQPEGGKAMPGDAFLRGAHPVRLE